MLPETGSNEDFRDAVIYQLPIWELSERLKSLKVEVVAYTYTPIFVRLHVKWERFWEVKTESNGNLPFNVSASVIKDYVSETASDQGYQLTRWDLIEAEGRWTETIDQVATEAKVLLKLPQQKDPRIELNPCGEVVLGRRGGLI